MSDLHRIRRVSAVMKAVCTVGVVAIPGAAAVFWAVVPLEVVRSLPGVGFDVAALPPVSRALAFLATMIPGAFAVFGLAALRRLFEAYRRGAIFAAGNARQLRAFAGSVLAAALARIVSMPVLSVVLSWHNPPGGRALAITVSSDDIATLFVGFLFLVVAWIMAEAHRLAEDSAQIV